MSPSFTTFLPTLLLAFSHVFPTLSQQLIPNNLPTCAASCAQLQNAQSSCTPAGGAPVSNDQTYQSCFCQSALLTQLYSQQSVQFCTQCSAQDMSSIQSWYKTFCAQGKSAGGTTSTGAGTPTSSGTSTPTSATSTRTTVQNTQTASPSPSAGAAGNSQGVTSTEDEDSGKPWFTTHWKWVVMLLVLILGLSLFTLLFVLFHRRYHRRREAQWSQATVSQPDITTWGPGQSVHDFGLMRSLSRSLSGKKRWGSDESGSTVTPMKEVPPPMPTYRPPPTAYGGAGAGAGAGQPEVKGGKRLSKNAFGGMF